MRFEMDGLQFIASLIGSLAWPAAVLIVLWYNRVRLSNLFSNVPEWLEEITLPGGTKFRFSKAVQKAAEKAELIAPKHLELEGSKSETPAPFRFHEPMVVESYLELVELCRSFVRLLPLPTNTRDPEGVIWGLSNLGFINPESKSLFTYLREAYQSAVREGYSRISEEDARRYRDAAQTLIEQLREVLPRVEAANPRKQAGWAN
jgi:hypothetical protein